MRHSTCARLVSDLRSAATVSILTVFVVPLVLVPGASLAEDPSSECLQAPRLALNATTLIEGPEASAALFAVEAPTPGRLAIELTVPGFELFESWIDLVPDACTSRNARKARRLEQSFSRQLWELSDPGLYFVRIGTVDPDRSPSRVKLSTRWRAEPPSTAGGEVTLTKDGGTEECDEEILPCYKAGWCAPGEPADDLAVCSRRLELNRFRDGELANFPGEDHDFFAFRLEHSQIVRLETSGSADTFGTLFDASGRRIAAADGGGEGENFALVAALRAGLYRVRVEGMPGTAGGVYRLWLSKSE